MKRKGRLFKKEGGVSEVLGSILVLLITVLLFSTVFYYVSTMPTPNPRIYAQFDATLNVEQDASGNYYLNITVKNVGGEALVDWRTMFIVVIDFTAKQHMLSEGKIAQQPFDSDHRFSQGESFYYNSSWDGFVYTDKDVIRALDISVTLYDKSSGNIIWSSKLQGRANMSPVLVGLTTKPVPVILGKPATLKAIVFDPDNDDLSNCKVFIDFSDSPLKSYIGDPSVREMLYDGRNSFTTIITIPDNDELNILRPYPVRVWINDTNSNVSYGAYLYLSRGTEVKTPDLYINTTFIRLSTDTPSHGDDVVITIVVQNRGGTSAEYHLRLKDVYPGYDNGYVYIQTDRGPSIDINDYGMNFSTDPGGTTVISILWKNVGTDMNGTEYSHVSGQHKLLVELINITPKENPDKYSDSAEKSFTVLPSILLVDDDGYAEGSQYDTSRYYKYILNTCGYKYDVEKSTLNGEQLRREIDAHDLVIWETGYNTNPMVFQRYSILSEFVRSKGGSLWLISQSESANNLKIVIQAITGESVELTSFMEISSIHGVSNSAINVTLSNGTLVKDTLINRDEAPNGNKSIYFSNWGNLKIFLEGNLLSSYHPLGVYKDELGDHEGKMVYMGFELPRLKHYYNQNFIAYRILKWLANISGRAGKDLAVEDMIIVPKNPLYMQPVNITVVVSNNGGEALASEVLLKVDGIISSYINTTNPQNTGDIPPEGGFVEVYFTWIPVVPGKHIITAVVDPYNRIEETNEENNIVNSEIIDTEVFVHFSTLIVYNGSSTDSINEKNSLVGIFRDLNYKYKTLDANDPPDNYEDGTLFAQYNLVIWADFELGNRDINAVKDSMRKNPSTGHIFIGSNLASEMMNNNELKTALEISNINHPSGSKRRIFYGVNNPQSITNGVAIIANASLYEIEAKNSQALFWAYKDLDDYEYSELEDTYAYRASTIPKSGYGIISKLSESGAKYAIVPFNTNDEIKGIFGLRSSEISKPYAAEKQAKALLLYRLFKYFGYFTLSPELATYPADIQIIYGGANPSLPPIVGRSYMLRTTIYNYGALGSTAIVRVYDDFEWIGSQSVYLPPANITNEDMILPSTAKIEIVWTPMFAGKARHIRVIVDPLNEVEETLFNNTQYSEKEIFNFNNEAIITKRVYYFWDNMENGDENWLHQATVMDINGESPLDFLNRKDVSTNVIGNWDWELSGSSDNGGNYDKDANVFYSNDTRVSSFTHGAYHSASSAFWMPEAPRSGIRKPIDVIFVIDTSGSMDEKVDGADVGDLNGDGNSNTRLDVAIAATEKAIDLLDNNDRVAIFIFDYESPQLELDFTYATENNKSMIYEDHLEKLKADSWTPLYDTVAYAVKYMDDNGRENAVKGILVLTDGLSNSDYHWYKYAPGTNNERDYEAEPGPIQYYINGDGLLEIPYSVMTISIAPDAWDGRLFPIGNSSTGNVSMAIFEDDPNAIQGAFTTFIVLLSQASTGGIRAISPLLPQSKDTKLGASNTISGLGAVVFSDGFRDTSWSSPGFDGTWIQSGFTIASTGDGHKYYKSQSSNNWQDEYWVAETSTESAYMEHMIYPTEVLKNHYPGSYSIKGAEIRFWIGRNRDSDWWSTEAEINVYAKGTLITQTPLEFSGREHYYNVTIPASIYTSTSPYYIKIEISSLSGTIGIDDVMVVYYIDYTPPDSGGTSGGGIPADYANVVSINENYSYLITPSVKIEGSKKAMLSFWTKYWMTQGTNGGIIYVWGLKDGESDWSWDKDHRYYLMPTQSYTGNLKFESVDAYASDKGPKINNQQTGLIDANDNKPYWCFNGRSGDGTFGWDYIEVDLTPYVSIFKEIRIVFMLVQFGGVPSGVWNPAMGWYLDDVKIMITGDGQRDLWQLKDFGGTGPEEAHSGNYAWAYGVENNNWDLPKGVDSSLVTKQIDLSTARTVNLLFYIRFNLNPAAGVPPATVRVEISDDNGMTWQSITYGVRIGWGASGTGGIAGVSSDGEYGWVRSGTLVRINCDLSGWAGRTIMLRFRVVTNATDTPTYAEQDKPHGVFLDDVVVYGEGYATLIPTSEDHYIWES